MKKFKRKIRLSKISAIHYFKLVFRSLLFLTALILYIVGKMGGEESSFGGFENNRIILGIIWAVFAVEMLLRFFPSSIESMGCEKQFAKNFMPTEERTPNLTSRKRVVAVAAVWVALNTVFGVLYLTGIFDRAIMLLISIAYSVCDMICILFFCPFQTWFLKNKCCTACRIYNWDYAMMFTPLVFVKNVYSWTLVTMALLLLVRWEFTFYKYPERFAENTNACLKCTNCKEKLCRHKKQLRRFLKDNHFRK